MHSHHHSHASDSNGLNRIGWAFFLNLSFTVLEFVGGWLTNSTAIMADAVHDLGDSLSIGSAWWLERLGGKSPTRHFTYGYRRLSLLGALINGIVLVAGSVWVMASAVPRLFDPVMPQTEGMLALAVVGVMVNGFAAYRLIQGKTLNERILNWHLLEDVLGWVAVLVIALIMQFVDWPILDPLLSVGFTLFILANVLRNVWATGRLFVQATPDSKLLTQVEQTLLKTGGVQQIHHLHLWSLDGERHVLTAHVVVDELEKLSDYADFKQTLQDRLSHYALAHTTIEVELVREHCRDRWSEGE